VPHKYYGFSPEERKLREMRRNARRVAMPVKVIPEKSICYSSKTSRIPISEVSSASSSDSENKNVINVEMWR